MKKLKLFGIVVALLFLASCEGGNDITPPTASSTGPADGAAGVAVDTVVTVTFNEAMDGSTITDSTFTLSSNPPVSGTVTYNSATNTATFTPDADLDYMTTYTATITTGAEDLAGNTLRADYVWSFTTDDEGSAVQLPETGQTTSYATGDDGDLQRGVSWPSPRFTDNGDGTVTDELTGLMWLKDADCFGVRTWIQSLSDANSLASGSCGLSDDSDAGDWRLSNVNELESLVNAEELNPDIAVEVKIELQKKRKENKNAPFQ